MPYCGSPSCSCTRKTWHRGDRQSFLRTRADVIRGRVVRVIAALGSTATFSPATGHHRRGWERITIDGKDALVMVGDGAIYLWSAKLGSHEFAVRKRGAGYLRSLRDYVVNEDAIATRWIREAEEARTERERRAAAETERRATEARLEAERVAAEKAHVAALKAICATAQRPDGPGHWPLLGIDFDVDYHGNVVMKLGRNVTATQAKAMVETALACDLARPWKQRP